MKIALRHRLKRAKQKMYIWRKKTFDTTYPGEVNAQQTAAYLICKKLIEKDNSILLMAPLSGKRYIRMDDNNLFVIISAEAVQIINHVYSYTIPMHGHVMRKTLDVFDNKMESIRIGMENEIKGNIQKSLNQIKEDLSKNVNNF